MQKEVKGCVWEFLGGGDECWFTLNKLNTTSNKLVAIYLTIKSKGLKQRQ